MYVLDAAGGGGVATGVLPHVVTSASDLTVASKCEFEFLRALDAKLGRIAAVVEKPDPMRDRAAELGNLHELRVLDTFKEQYGEGVVEIERPNVRAPGELEAAAAATEQAFADRVDVVFQATFFDGDFLGFADFIVHLGDGVYEVQDTKLARSAKVTALLQLAAYGEQLERLGVTTGETVRLVLGDGSVSVHRLADILPVYRNRRDRLRQIVDERVRDSDPVQWGDPRYTVCGRCDTCSEEVEAHRDLLLVAGMRLSQRARLTEAGITTIEQLAASTGDVEGITDVALTNLRNQAALQLVAVAPGDPPAFELYNAAVLAAMPVPVEGDIFFDFEGDPLYAESRGAKGEAHDWGLDYLFGVVEHGGDFVPFWAHNHLEERAALIAFLDYLRTRRAQHPDMHIYHYAPYERTHLLSLAARHGVGEQQIDDLLRDNVLVDLYPHVRKSTRVGSRSYSLKKLEPLYMGDEIRDGMGVEDGAESITAYATSRQLASMGDAEGAQRILDDIADYNRYDCVSTRKLRDWLLARAAEQGVMPGTIAATPREPVFGDPSPLHEALLELAGDPLAVSRSDDSVALALAAASIDYHRRENKSFWWEHFSRLIQPIENWADTRDVFVVESAEVEVDWHVGGRQTLERRVLRLHGQLAPGSSLKVGDQPFVVYEYPGPFAVPGADPGARPFRTARILEIDGSVRIEEVRSGDVDPYFVFPSALTPPAPPDPGSQVTAIAEWGQAIVDAAPAWPTDAVLDILRRVPPRTRSGSLAQAAADTDAPAVADVPAAPADPIAAVTKSLLDLDSSYLAVQGPPGTGKTYLASHVIAALVRDHGWKIGVVAQSHSVVEHVLDKVVEAGLPASLVAKVPKVVGSATFTELPKDGQPAFAAEHDSTGFVIGGTAWDFSKTTRFPRRSLDLLVIDEAGQFSLAYTIATSLAARNLLLLGDPQQLPQVSQGTHPEEINQSALGWIADGRDVLPGSLGYFLAESRRMHAALTEPVSRLAYEGQLRSHSCAQERLLEGIAPGLHAVPIEHTGNSTSSPEEAARVVKLVRSVIAKNWSDPSMGREKSPLGPDDIIVVTPYNAQVTLIQEALEAHGFGAIRVGTVDKFQGQEAAVAIVSLAASSAAEVPRGMQFLIMKNRLNVAISRAQWAAVLLYSPALIDYLPWNAAAVAELSAFITLVGHSKG